jgi:hypothetical protein
MTSTENLYALVSDNILIGTVSLDPNAPSYNRKKEGFESTSEIIDITDNHEARIGSSWDGSQFTHDDSDPAHIVLGQHRFAFISEGKIFFIKRVMPTEAKLNLFSDAVTKGISVYKVVSDAIPEIGSAWN